MAQSKKEHGHHANASAEHDVKPKKKETSRKKALLLRLVSRNRKDIIKVSVGAIVLAGAVGAVPFPHAFAKSIAVEFATENQKNAGLELGDSKVLQEGRDGTKIVSVEAHQSIWGRLLGIEPTQQKIVSEKVVDNPASKIVAIGSKKYQYMLCSGGGYRYFTDEQFKDPNTGFTSKSEDYCKTNNQGTKVKLADSPDGTTYSQALPSLASRAPVSPGCKEISVPFGTEYQNVSYLPRGTREVASQGMNGFILRCPGTADIKSSGVNQLVLVGTGKTTEEIQAEIDAAEVARQQEETTRNQAYYLALANCIQSLRAQGMQQSSAEYHCKSMVRR